MAEPIEIVKKSFLRKRNDDAGVLDYGKLPPQEKELEEVVLGAVLIERDCIEDIISFIKDEVFYIDAHQRIWRAVEVLYAKNAPIDLLTVTNQLKEHGDLDSAGGAFYIAQLTNKIGSAANVEYHARVVYEAYIKRQTIAISTESIKDAYDDTNDAFEVLERAEKNLSLLAENKFGTEGQNVGASMRQEMNLIEARMSMDEHELTGVTSGFHELDRIIGGWQKSDLIIVAGRPASGKTAASLNFARNAAIMGKKSVAVFSLEMSTAQLTQRLMSGEAEISNDRLRNGKLNDGEWSRLTSSLDYLASASIVIDDTPALSIMELKAKARRLHKDHRLELIVIDYLQLMSGTGARLEGSREQEVSAISRGLKALAKELNIPVIALSQLSRAVETRGGEHKPILSDLRESGSIEADADIVIFLYRPEYYGLTTDAEGNSTEGIGYFNIAKHRNGELKECKVAFQGQYTKFKNLFDGGGITIENHTQNSERSGSSIAPTDSQVNTASTKKYIDKHRIEQREKKANPSEENTSIQQGGDDYDDSTPF